MHNMKKFAALFLAVIMTFSLSACGSSNNNDRNSDRDNRNNRDTVEESNSTDESSKINNFRNNSGNKTGTVGDTMSTQWFDFTVNSATAYGNEYEGYSAESGYQLLVVNVTIKNTFNDVNPMFYSDFTIVWGSSDDYYDYPLQNAESLSDDFLPDTYYMDPGDEVTGNLLFEIPAAETDFKLSYVEVDDEDNVYDTYTVSFQVEAFEYETETFIGVLGETMSTYWFDFSVDEAVLTNEYEGSTPSDGNVLLVLTMTIVNTYFEDVPMYRGDFDVEWDDPDSYETPISIFINGEELTEEIYYLPCADLVDATFVYEVAEGYNEFIVYFDEYFADETLGNIFGVYIVPDEM